MRTHTLNDGLYVVLSISAAAAEALCSSSSAAAAVAAEKLSFRDGDDDESEEMRRADVDGDDSVDTMTRWREKLEFVRAFTFLCDLERDLVVGDDCVGVVA
jgi:hypothetical protein